MERRSVGPRGNRKAHMRTQFLPLLNNSGVVRQVRRPVQEWFGFRQIVALDKAVAESREGVPVVRIITTGLFKDRNRLTAAAVFFEQESCRDVRICQIARHRSIVRSNLMRDGKDRYITPPLLLLG